LKIELISKVKVQNAKLQLKTLHGDIALPAFFPDGTRGVVKGVDSTDLEKAGVEGLVINAYHLLINNLSGKIGEFGGIHRFMNWGKPIVTDSGGFQVMSLVRDHPEMGKISDQGIIFLWEGKKILLTPEKSIQLQLEMGTDIAIVLDDCVRPSEALVKEATKPSLDEESVRRTILWAKRSKKEFEDLVPQTSSGKAKILLFAVVQGGANKNLRKYCAQELIKIGFDGYCFGGFPVDIKGKFLTEILKYTAKLLPDDKPKFALGIGKPENIVECFKVGYTIFDCVIPTREARHGKLYVYRKNPQNFDLKDNNFYSNIAIRSSKWAKDIKPVSKFCDCLTCQNYSRAYLHYLFKIGDSLAVRLSTIHNLRFYCQLMEKLNKSYRLT